jgi:hypothetical protein
MNDFLMWIGGIIATGLFSLIGWVFTMVFARINEIKLEARSVGNELDAHKLYAANNYANKNDVKTVRDEIVRHLERIEDKMDRRRSQDPDDGRNTSRN